MGFDVKDYKEKFNSEFYQPAYNEWRVDNKSGKDTVGRYYEKFIDKLYSSYGLPIYNKKMKILGSEYNADTVIGTNEKKIILVSEDKGHYLDKTFLKRALSNATDLCFECLESNTPLPFFVINCPTTYGRYEVICDKELRKYDNEIVNILKEKLRYFPVCKHDRIPEKKYFTSINCSFEFDDALIENKLNFIKELTYAI
jgi:hypothetical protein